MQLGFEGSVLDEMAAADALSASSTAGLVPATGVNTRFSAVESPKGSKVTRLCECVSTVHECVDACRNHSYDVC